MGSQVTQFKMGAPRVKHAGRVKGTPNKTTVQVKEAILNAFEQCGGVNYLVMVALADPKTFCTLLGRVLPTELSGPGGGPVQVITSTMTPQEAAAAYADTLNDR
jgi:hypothetical protein